MLAGCDMVDENDRFKEMEIEISEKKRVLLEDFTGQECVNCPAAAKVATGLKSVYGDKLVVVSIHAGAFSRPTLRTEEGTAYDAKFHPQEMGYPAGMINRSYFDGNYIFTNPDSWGAYVLAQLESEAVVDFEMTPVYDEAAGTIQVKAVFDSDTDLSNVNFQLWVIESGIIAPQKSVNPDGSVSTISDYEHNHVLRGAINGTWGEPISLKEGEKIEYTSPVYTLKSKWVPENMGIVGFVYNTANNEIYQCLEIHMIQTEH